MNELLCIWHTPAYELMVAREVNTIYTNWANLLPPFSYQTQGLFPFFLFLLSWTFNVYLLKINFSYFYNCFGFIVFIGFLHQNKTQYCGINMWLSVQVMPRFAYFKGVFSKFLRGVPPDPPGTALALRALAHFSQLINQVRFIFNVVIVIIKLINLVRYKNN